jgi:hypothetical protein
VSPLSTQCSILNISQPYRPLWPVTGLALLFFCFTFYLYIIQSFCKLFSECKFLNRKVIFHRVSRYISITQNIMVLTAYFINIYSIIRWIVSITELVEVMTFYCISVDATWCWTHHQIPVATSNIYFLHTGDVEHFNQF